MIDTERFDLKLDDKLWFDLRPAIRESMADWMGAWVYVVLKDHVFRSTGEGWAIDRELRNGLDGFTDRLEVRS